MEVRKPKKIFLEISIFIAVFFNGMIGAKMGALSLNKISIIPLICYLFFSEFSNKTFKFIKIKYINKTQLIWYFSCIISLFIGLFRVDISYRFNGYTNSLINYFGSIVIFYIPIVLLIGAYSEKEQFYEIFIKMLILTCRIQMTWALIQFILYVTIKFDLNDAVLVQLLGGLGRKEWTNFLWDYGSPVLRISGLNYDGAYLGYFLLIGFIFDKKLVYRASYVLTILVSMQRSAVIGLAIIILYYIFTNTKVRSYLFNRKTLEYILVSSVLIGIFTQIPILNNYFEKFMLRFDFFTSSTDDLSVSSLRHILYLPYAIKTIFELDPLICVFGIGPRASGVAFVLNSENIRDLSLSSFMYNNVWSVECDFAEILLGTGIFGLLSYYTNCFNIYKIGDMTVRSFIVLLVFLGIMYDFSHLTITHLILIVLYLKSVISREI